jgi:hypothetical protein
MSGTASGAFSGTFCTNFPEVPGIFQRIGILRAWRVEAREVINPFEI